MLNSLKKVGITKNPISKIMTKRSFSKSIALSSILCASLHANTIQIKDGWNFVGFDNDKDFSSDTIISNEDNINIIWKYNTSSKTWSAYSPNSSTKEAIVQNGYDFDTILDKSSGAWILAKKDFSYTENKNHSMTNSDITIASGWNLLSAVDNSDISINDNIFQNNLVWVYRDNNWYLKHNLTTIDTSGINTLSEIKPNEAFWVYKSLNSYFGKWIYTHSGDEVYIDTTWSSSDFNTTDSEDVIKIGDYSLIRASIPDISVNGQVDLPSSLGRKLYSTTNSSNIKVKLQNTKDENIKAETFADTSGKFLIPPSLPSGEYNCVIVDESKQYQDIEKTIIIKDKDENIGTFKLTNNTSHNFKAELIVEDDFIYANGQKYNGKIRVYNISKVQGTGLNYAIKLNDNLVDNDILGSMSFGTYKDIPITIQFDSIENSSKTISVDVTLTDIDGVSWIDTFDFEVYKKEMTLNIATKSANVKGYIIMPNTNEVKNIDISNGSIKLPTFDQNYELVLSNSNISDETKYSIGVNKLPSIDFSLIKDSRAHEPNNSKDSATKLKLNDTVMSYLHVTDIDYWDINLSYVPTIAPTLSDTNLSISENMQIGLLVGSVSVLDIGDSEISSFVMSGEDSAFFDISSDGKITTKQSFDYEVKTNYTFNIKATNNAGDSESKVVNIGINNISDVVPTLLATEFEVNYDDLSVFPIKIGNIKINDNGDSEINSFEIVDETNEYFSIDANGDIYINNNLVIAESTSFEFNIKAKNSAGYSEEVKLKITINKEDDDTSLDAPNTPNIGDNTTPPSTPTIEATSEDNINSNIVTNQDTITKNINSNSIEDIWNISFPIDVSQNYEDVEIAIKIEKDDGFSEEVIIITPSITNGILSTPTWIELKAINDSSTYSNSFSSSYKPELLTKILGLSNGNLSINLGTLFSEDSTIKGYIEGLTDYKVTITSNGISIPNSQKVTLTNMTDFSRSYIEQDGIEFTLTLTDGNSGVETPPEDEELDLNNGVPPSVPSF
jgi:hypothetical protein